MLIKCWASVADGGPTFNQHLADISSLFDIHFSTNTIDWPNVEPTLNQHWQMYSGWWEFSSASQEACHRPNFASMLGHRLRRRPNIGQTLGRGLVFAGWSETMTRTKCKEITVCFLPRRTTTTCTTPVIKSGWKSLRNARLYPSQNVINEWIIRHWCAHTVETVNARLYPITC